MATVRSAPVWVEVVSSLYSMVAVEGLVVGMAEGLVVGMAEGLVEGLVEGMAEGGE